MGRVQEVVGDKGQGRGMARLQNCLLCPTKELKPSNLERVLRCYREYGTEVVKW